MTAHVVTIDVDLHTAVDNHGKQYETHETRYRWRCSCRSSGAWKVSARRARQGGIRHAAMLERGKR